jgi:hypothetical protein
MVQTIPARDISIYELKEKFGLLINGREFVFIKLIQQEYACYARSDALSIERDIMSA